MAAVNALQIQDILAEMALDNLNGLLYILPSIPLSRIVINDLDLTTYSGGYQERTFFYQFSELKKVAEPLVSSVIVTDPVIIYPPLILDWYGAKLSESLYVKRGAYGYLDEQNKANLLEFRVTNKRDRCCFR
ncbi:hypothetical protein C8Q78DRAFT_992544 [Trametes maxima]|nr:hypothetical protein C8Q78DRAFT_992544 [Trametes maxima]